MDEPSKGSTPGGISMSTNKFTIDQLLQSSADYEYKNDAFIDEVMDSITNREILSSNVRTVNDQQIKKGSFMSRIKLLPPAALAALLLVALVLVGGTAYAAVHYFWEPAHVQTGTQSMVDNHQATKISVSGCQSIPSNVVRADAAQHTEIGAKRVKQMVQAECELSAVNAYAASLNTNPKATSFYALEPCVSQLPSRFMVGDTLTVPACQGIPERHLKVTSSTEYIKNGVPVERSQITDASTIAFIGHSPNNNANTGTLTAIVALPLPVDDYSAVGEGISFVQPCMGNAADLCHTHNSEADVYDYIANGNDPSTFLPAVVGYEGKISSISGDAITFRTTSGHVLTVQLPAGQVAAYDQTAQAGMKLHTGDTISVIAVKAQSRITSHMISHVGLLTETDYKTGLISAF